MNASPTLPELLRRAAARYPTRLAVRDGERGLTYEALLDEVNRHAAYLRRAGCEPGVAVASFLPRSVEAIVVQAAILHAGGVYVPLDPTYPADLVARMLRGSGVTLAVVAGSKQADLAGAPVTTVALDHPATARAIAGGPALPPWPGPGPGAGAYVIHTSGSTGQPKGVLVGHRAIALSTIARWRRYPGPVRGFLLVSPMTFDSSMAGVWWTLSRGGTLRLAPTDPAALLTAVRQAVTTPDPGLSHTLLTPTLYRQALDGLDRADSTLERVVVAGEPCPPALVRQHHRLLPGVELVNEYGPTEAAVWCSSAVLRPDEDVHIGTPITGVDLLVVDAAGAVLDGSPGELCIAGDQLATGYVGDPALTASRFVPHPLRPGQRMYRSGDRARRRPDGAFDLVGRLDEQVKIRGYRVDLAGVRARLSEHPGVADVAVAVRHRTGPSHIGSHPVLTAYVVPDADDETTARRLREAWTAVVDDIATTVPAGDDNFDTSGWTSSYTGGPLSDEDMREWVERTVAVLREHSPARVLDLGCGTGLPLLRLAPGCHRYVALDPSRSTLDRLRRVADRAGLDRIELRQGEASDAASYSGAGFDLVACNSVSQYFPSGAYLRRTVRGALRAVRPDGRVVLGDVRDLSLREAFHASVVLAQARDDVPAAVLAARLAQRIADDAQLMIDPRWFATAAPAAHVQVRPRRGRRRNEMNDFRYDAILYAGEPAVLIEIDHWLQLDPAGRFDPRPVVDALHTGRTVGLRAVPNARTAGAHAVAAALATGAVSDAGQLRALAADAEAAAVHPEELIGLAAAHGYRCHLSRAAARPDGSIDAAFVPRDADGPMPRFDTPAEPAVAEPAELTTEPVRQQIVTTARAALIPRLREHAAATLPPYERPGAYVALAELPVTRHGKLDVAALPDPRAERPPVSTPYAPPETVTERAIAAVWADLLAVDQIGRDDPFTELGGDSLLATECVITLTERFGVALPAGALFTAPTVAALARLVDREPVHRIPGPRRSPDPDASGELPLGGAQTAFWFLDHYRRPGSARHPDFALPVHYRIHGPVDVDALGTAVDRLLERHPALHTRLHLAADEGHQRVLPPWRGVLRRRVLSTVDAEAALREAAKTDAARPLAPAEGRVFTAEFTSASDTEHLLVIRVHHMVSDGWSLGILEQELTELYHAARAGRPADLPAVPDYADLVRGIDRAYFVDLGWRDTAPNRDALRYWTAQTAGARPIRLTGTEPDPAGPATRVCGVLLPANEADAVVEAARRTRGTLFAAVLAVLAQLLAADTGDDDVRLMTIAAARDAPGLHRLIGMLLNPLFLRMRPISAAAFADQVRAADSVVRATLTHGQVPVLALCEEVPDLLSVMTESQFVAVEALPPVRGLGLDGCAIQRTDPFDDEFLGTGFALPVDLLLTTRPEEAGLRLAALYDPAVFDDGYVRRLVDRLRRALVAGGNDPTAPLAVRADPGPTAPPPHRQEDDH